MAGNILFLHLIDGQEEPVAAVPNLSSYEAKVQLDALEQQANSTGKMLVVTAVLQPFPSEEPEPEPEAKHGKS